MDASTAQTESPVVRKPINLEVGSLFDHSENLLLDEQNKAAEKKPVEQEQPISTKSADDFYKEVTETPKTSLSDFDDPMSSSTFGSTMTGKGIQGNIAAARVKTFKGSTTENKSIDSNVGWLPAVAKAEEKVAPSAAAAAAMSATFGPATGLALPTGFFAPVIGGVASLIAGIGAYKATAYAQKKAQDTIQGKDFMDVIRNVEAQSVSDYPVVAAVADMAASLPLMMTPVGGAKYAEKLGAEMLQKNAKYAEKLGAEMLQKNAKYAEKLGAEMLQKNAMYAGEVTEKALENALRFSKVVGTAGKVIDSSVSFGVMGGGQAAAEGGDIGEVSRETMRSVLQGGLISFIPAAKKILTAATLKPASDAAALAFSGIVWDVAVEGKPLNKDTAKEFVDQMRTSLPAFMVMNLVPAIFHMTVRPSKIEKVTLDARREEAKKKVTVLGQEPSADTQKIRDVIREHIAQERINLPGGVIVHPTADSFDMASGGRAKADGEVGAASGFVTPDGVVHVDASHPELKNKDGSINETAVRNLVTEEAVGHYGVEKVLGDKFSSFASQISSQLSPEQRDMIKKTWGIKDDARLEENIGAEQLAHFAINDELIGKTWSKLFDNVVSVFSKTMRELGVTKKYSRAEIRQVLRNGWQYAREGNGSSGDEAADARFSRSAQSGGAKGGRPEDEIANIDRAIDQTKKAFRSALTNNERVFFGNKLLLLERQKNDLRKTSQQWRGTDVVETDKVAIQKEQQEKPNAIPQGQAEQVAAKGKVQRPIGKEVYGETGASILREQGEVSEQVETPVITKETAREDETAIPQNDRKKVDAIHSEVDSNLPKGQELESARQQVISNQSPNWRDGLVKIGEVDGDKVYLADFDKINATHRMDDTQGENGVHDRITDGGALGIPDDMILVDAKEPAERIHRIAVHEAVEKHQMARGLDYEKAHPVANAAEREYMQKKQGNAQEAQQQDFRFSRAKKTTPDEDANRRSSAQKKLATNIKRVKTNLKKFGGVRQHSVPDRIWKKYLGSFPEQGAEHEIGVLELLRAGRLKIDFTADEKTKGGIMDDLREISKTYPEIRKLMTGGKQGLDQIDVGIYGNYVIDKSPEGLVRAIKEQYENLRNFEATVLSEGMGEAGYNEMPTTVNEGMLRTGDFIRTPDRQLWLVKKDNDGSITLNPPDRASARKPIAFPRGYEIEDADFIPRPPEGHTLDVYDSAAREFGEEDAKASGYGKTGGLARGRDEANLVAIEEAEYRRREAQKNAPEEEVDRIFEEASAYPAMPEIPPKEQRLDDMSRFAMEQDEAAKPKDRNGPATESQIKQLVELGVPEESARQQTWSIAELIIRDRMAKAEGTAAASEASRGFDDMMGETTAEGRMAKKARSMMTGEEEFGLLTEKDLLTVGIRPDDIKGMDSAEIAQLFLNRQAQNIQSRKTALPTGAGKPFAPSVGQKFQGPTPTVTGTGTPLPQTAGGKLVEGAIDQSQTQAPQAPTPKNIRDLADGRNSFTQVMQKLGAWYTGTAPGQITAKLLDAVEVVSASIQARAMNAVRTVMAQEANDKRHAGLKERVMARIADMKEAQDRSKKGAGVVETIATAFGNSNARHVVESAFSVWRDAGKDLQYLQESLQRAQDLLQSNQTPKKNRMLRDFIRYVKTAIDIHQNNIDYFETVDIEYEKQSAAILRDLNETLVAHGLDPVPYRANWINHYMKGTSMEDSLLGMSEQHAGKRSTSMTKERKYKTFIDAIETSTHSVASFNSVDLLGRTVGNVHNLIMRWNVFDGLKSVLDPVWDVPVVTDLVDRPRVQRGAPQGTALPQMGPLGRKVVGTKMEVPDDRYEVLELGRGNNVAVLKAYSSLFKGMIEPIQIDGFEAGWHKVMQTSKSVTLAFDTMHLARIAIKLGTSFVNPKGYKEGLTLLENDSATLERLRDMGEISNEECVRLLSRQAMVDRFGLTNSLNNGRIQDNMHQEWIRAIPMLGDMNRFIFDKFQKGGMTYAFASKFQSQLKSLLGKQGFDRWNKIHEQMSDSQQRRNVSASDQSWYDATGDRVGRDVAWDLNRMFGAIGRQGVFKTQRGLSRAKTIFLAPQWVEGLIRTDVVGVGKQLADSGVRLAKGERPYLGVLAKQQMTLVGGMFVIAQMLNLAHRGKFTWDNEEEGIDAKISAFIPDPFGKEGDELRLSPIALAFEISHQLVRAIEKSGFDPNNDANTNMTNINDAIETVVGYKLHPVTRAGMTYYETTKFHRAPGTRKATPTLREQLKETGKAAIPVPIGAPALWNAVAEKITGEEHQQFRGEYSRQIAATGLGVKLERAESAEERMRNIALKWNSSHNVIQETEFNASKYKDLKNAIQMGRTNDAETELDMLRNGPYAVTEKELWRYATTGIDYPFTGKRSTEKAFYESLTDEQKATYKKAIMERKDIHKEIINFLRSHPKKKIGTASIKTPIEDQEQSV